MSTIVVRLVRVLLVSVAAVGMVMGVGQLLSQAQRVAAAPTLQSGTGIVRVAITGTNVSGCGSVAMPCATIQFAADEAQAGDEIRIAAGTYTSVSVRGSLTQVVYISKSLTVRGGYTTMDGFVTTDAAANPTIVDAQGSGRVVFITSTNLQLENLVIQNGNGQFVDFNCPRSGCGGGIYADQGIILTRVNVLSNTSSSEGGGMWVNGEVTLKDSLFQNNRCLGFFCSSGGLRANSLASLTNVTFLSNTSGGIGDGGGARIIGSAIVINSRFENNNSGGGKGGGLSAISVILTNTFFISNRASSNGGGVYVSDSAVLNGGVFQDNLAGGLYAGSAAVSGTQFINNSNSQGGGLFSSGNVTLTNALFLSNSATGSQGGGLYTGGSMKMTNSQFISNSGYGGMGGAFVNGTAELTGGLFQDNRVIQGNGAGAGLFANALVMSGTQFIGNVTPNSDGGGAFIVGGASLQGGLFQNNRSASVPLFFGRNGGGGLSAGSIIVTGTQFISNSASLGGGLRADGAVTLTDVIFLSNTAVTSGGGASLDGTTSIDRAVFQDNQCSGNFCSGGGLSAGNLTLRGSRFTNNLGGDGGALYVAGAGNAQIINSLFVQNRGRNTNSSITLSSNNNTQILHTTIANYMVVTGTAIRTLVGNVGITNTIIANHSISILRLGGTVFEDYNLFFGNVTNTVGTVTSGSHHPTGNPNFVNPALDNYHLGAGSAAIDAGTNVGVVTDFDGDGRPQGSGFDIGFDEFVPLTPLSGLHITVSPIPTTTLGNTTTFTATITAGSLPITYTWSFGDSTGSSSGNPVSHTYTAAGVYTAIVTATNSLGALTATTTVTVTTPQQNVYLPLVIR